MGIATSVLPGLDERRFDMWRYARLLPLDEGPIRYPLSVGWTPLIAPARLRDRLGLPGLWLKDETRGPSGSNKDRGTALVLEHAVRSGADTVSCASTGNVAASLAIGAAAVGLRAVVFVPAEVSPTKLNLMLHSGATVLRVAQGYEAAFELSQRAAQTYGWLDRNTGINPATVEAKKTAGFEIWEQLGRQVPQLIVAPVGDGVTLCALAKAFDELHACDAIAVKPRIIGVQARGCAPVERAWTDSQEIVSVEPHTIADGIAVGNPLFGTAALDAVRRSGGDFVTVSDAEILDAAALLARVAGVLAEPAGATAMAGLLEARRRHLVDDAETVVVHVTGTSLKMPQFFEAGQPPEAINASLADVEAFLKETPAP